MTLARIEQVYGLVVAMGSVGATVSDVEEMHDLGHGPASAALSRLTREGRLVRLQERREGMSVYIHPRHASQRPTARPKRSRHSILVDALHLEAERARRRADMAQDLTHLQESRLHREYAERLEALVEKTSPRSRREENR